MTAQDLKNSILQLAVQGKLVPQCKEDEPASELMKLISAEKEQQIKCGKVSLDKKHTPDSITDEDIPYDIPENWCWVRFADIVSFYSGKTPERHTSEYWNSGEYTWVSIADMVANGTTVDSKEKVTQKAIADVFSGKITPAGTMIMSFKLTIGKISMLGVDAVHNEAIISIFPFIENDILKQYLFTILPLISNSGDFKNAVKGKTLNATSLSNLMIPLPPISEQNRILLKLNDLEPMVEEYGKAQEQLATLNAEFPDKLRKSILQQAVQGKLTERDPSDEPASELLKRIKAEKENLIKSGKIKKDKPLPAITDDEKPFDIPDTWEWSNINSLFWVTKLAGFEYTKYFTKETINANNDVHIVRAQHVKMNHFFENDNEAIPMDLSVQLERSALTTDCLLMTFIGAGIGDTCIYHSDKRHHLAPNVAKIVPQTHGIYLPYYLIWLMSPSGQANVEAIKKSTAQPSLSMETIRSIQVAVPPLAEQKRIVKRVDELLALCEGLK